MTAPGTLRPRRTTPFVALAPVPADKAAPAPPVIVDIQVVVRRIRPPSPHLRVPGQRAVPLAVYRSYNEGLIDIADLLAFATGEDQ